MWLVTAPAPISVMASGVLIWTYYQHFRETDPSNSNKQTSLTHNGCKDSHVVSARLHDNVMKQSWEERPHGLP